MPGPYTGTCFTVTAPTFLSFSNAAYAPDSGDLVLLEVLNTGKITAVEFTASNHISIGNPTLYLDNIFYGTYDISADGFYTDRLGDQLMVSGAPAVTPEPSPFTLVGSGVLCLAGVLRKRLAS